MSLHDLEELRFAKKITKDFEAVFQVLLKFRDELHPYRNYTVVSSILAKLESSVDNLDSNYEYYSQVLKTKGKKDQWKP